MKTSEFHQRLMDLRERCNLSFLTAQVTNRIRYSNGDAKATEEYIYSNQITDAHNIVTMFYENGSRVISVQKKTKVGADGLMIYLAKLMTTHNDDKFVVNPDNVFLLTGMNNKPWEDDFKDKAPCFFKNIYHHGKLSRAKLSNLRDALIIIDEIDAGNKEQQKLHQMLKEAGVLDVEHMKSHNIRFVLISATMMKELYDLYRWGDLHETYKMSIPSSYIGHTDFLERGLIQEFYPLDTKDNAEKWVTKDILSHYGTDYRVHLVRGDNKTLNLVQNACIQNGIAYRSHDSIDRISKDEIKEMFEDPLRKHIVLGIKGLYRRANMIPDKWKLRIGATHERYTKKVDNNVQIQGFTGRMCGFWREPIENGHKTGPHRTSIQAIIDYEKAYTNPFGEGSYQSAGFTKTAKGKVTAGATMLSAKNIANLKPIELPLITEDSVYDVTEPWSDQDKLTTYIRSRIKRGKITNYGIVDDMKFHYRGNLLLLYMYVSSEQFKTLDVFGGLNKEVKEEHTVCRVMPVIYNDQTQWVGIYVKSAWQEE